MSASMRITFEQGSGVYDAGSETFTFTAHDDAGPVHCGIARQAFEKVSGLTHLQADIANVAFLDAESRVFEIAQRKYARVERQISGAIMIRLADVTR